MILSRNRKLLLPIGVFIFFSFLFFLPGSAFPKENWLNKIWFDKWVHIGIFVVLVFLWSRALEISTVAGFTIIVIVALLYGFAVEIVQHYFIPNRSFDLGDVAADLIGCFGGVWLRTVYKK